MVGACVIDIVLYNDIVAGGWSTYVSIINIYMTHDRHISYHLLLSFPRAIIIYLFPVKNKGASPPHNA